jgi:hypothetical protein
VETGHVIRQAIAAMAEYKLRRGGGGGARPLRWCSLLDGAESVVAEELEKNLYYLQFIRVRFRVRIRPFFLFNYSRFYSAFFSHYKI